jgi:hypothetical protein
MRHRLRKEVDPIPPFAAQLVPVDGKDVGVIRVYESADRPHIVRGAGAVFVREPGGKRAVDDHRELLQLAQYGREADTAARRRLEGLPYPSIVLEAPELRQPPLSYSSTKSHQFVVRSTPLTIPGAFADRALARKTGDLCVNLMREIFPGPPAPSDAQWEGSFSHGQRGFAVTMKQYGALGQSSTAVVDAGGVVAIRLQWPQDLSTQLHPKGIASSELVDLLKAIVSILTDLDAYGRCLCQLILRGFGGMRVVDSSYGGGGTIPEDSLPMGGELSIPLDEDEADQQAARWGREIARAAGLEAWES